MKKKNDLGIPDSTINMLAREILTFTRNYLSTEEGRREFEEWKRRRAATFTTARLTERHFSSIVRGSHKKRTAYAVPFCVIYERKGYASYYFYCLYHIKSHRKNQRYHRSINYI